MDAVVVGRTKKLPHDECMNFIESLGMLVCTMTTWDYGMGYVGLEAMSKSILAISKNSIYAKDIKSEVVDVKSPNDLIRTAKECMDNPDEYHAKRRCQWEWGKEHFTDEAIGNRFKEIIQDAIDNGWQSVDTKFRRF